MTRGRASRAGLPGFTVPEVMASLFILTLGIVTATMLVNLLLRTTRVTREDLVATNLAREGLEAVRNVRDTNWQANSGSQRDADEAREHWNDEFKVMPSLTGQVFLPVVTGTATQPAWALRAPADADPATGFAVSCPAAGASAAEQGQLFRAASGRYVQQCEAALGAPARTRFRRELRVTFLDATTKDAAPTTDLAVAKMAWVQARVRWYPDTDPAAWNDTNHIGEVRLETVLTDWFGRKDKPTP